MTEPRFLAQLLAQQCLYDWSSVNLTFLQCSSPTSVQCSSFVTENVPTPTRMSVSGEEEADGECEPDTLGGGGTKKLKVGIRVTVIFWLDNVSPQENQSWI